MWTTHVGNIKEKFVIKCVGKGMLSHSISFSRSNNLSEILVTHAYHSQAEKCLFWVNLVRMVPLHKISSNFLAFVLPLFSSGEILTGGPNGDHSFDTVWLQVPA